MFVCSLLCVVGPPGRDAFRFGLGDTTRASVVGVVVAAREKKVCVCYTSDLQTSPIFTVDYYKGVAKSAAEAGAHMIGIKVSEPRAKS